MSALDRIDQLKTEIADARAKQLIAAREKAREGQEETERAKALEFLCKITGVRPEGEADVLERALADPWTGICAIIAYLEEKGI